jgi:hypothetical protein
MMTKPVLVSLVLLAVYGTLWGDVAPAPFSLAVVPSRSFGDGGIISMSHDKPQDFYVVLTNGLRSLRLSGNRRTVGATKRFHSR